jgi:hypothetical protein
MTARVKHFGSELDAIEHCSREEICDPALPACIDVVARDLANDGRPLPALFSTLLTRPDISPEVGRALIARAAQVKGLPVKAVASGIETVSSPYAVRLGSATYMDRDGSFLKKGKRGDFESISNFSARIISAKPGRGANPVLDVKLTAGNGSTNFSITDAAFNNPQRLWKAIRSAANEAGLPYPIMTTVPDRKLLPEIIRGTRGKE